MSPAAGFHDDITDVPGIRVGHAENTQAATGVTVILVPEEGVPAGLQIGGSAPSTRQVDSLHAAHVVDRVHAVCFCGGSGFGLDASGGVMAYLEECGVGFRVVERTVPIVPTAAIFDLNLGNGQVRPDAHMGRQAAVSASSGPIAQGSVGAGTGATVGKLFGMTQAMKSGIGSASTISGDLIVGALVVLNAYGDVTDECGKILAGCRSSVSALEFADAAALLKEGKARSRRVSVENTTLSVVAVNARMDKISASRIAVQSTLGLGRVIRPFHSRLDGDLTIVLAVGDTDADHGRIALLAEEALQRSLIRAINAADGLGLLPARRDLGLVQQSSTDI